MCVKTSIEWIRKYDIKLKKSFGQNFLKNQNISKKIIALLPEISNSTFIEIGPGAGSLTEELLNSGRDVHAFEIDRNLEELLNERFKGNKRFHLH
jgi:16S rRNA (adenine1518-N6/adenine1519-N6)-dimethyltransferase